MIPRYQTMKGRKVNRVFGWDTHGLPAELEAQKELGIDSVDQIEKMGIDKFNDACRASVLKYTNEWQNYVHRQARWVDFEHGYKTLNIPSHGIRDVGLQAALRQGPGLPGLPRAAVLPEGPHAVECARAAHGRRRVPGPPGHHRIRGRQDAR